MTDRPDPFKAGRQLLELQLAMMTGAMTLVAESAQRAVELGLAAAATAGGASGRRPDPVAHAPAAAVPRAPRSQSPIPTKAARAPTGKDYALRMQHDVDSILHAFAMVPDAADRLIRTSALLTEKPGKEPPLRASTPAKPVPRRRLPRDAREHAR